MFLALLLFGQNQLAELGGLELVETAVMDDFHHLLALHQAGAEQRRLVRCAVVWVPGLARTRGLVASLSHVQARRSGGAELGSMHNI